MMKTIQVSESLSYAKGIIMCEHNYFIATDQEK